MGSPTSIDLLILGAGPAGLSTAMHLLQLDPSWADRMLLLEKAAHPRHKLCGGGVTRFGMGVLKDLGFDLPLPIPQARVDDVRLQYASRMVHVHGQPQIAIFHRQEFDAYLASQARQRGAVIQENEPVRKLELDEEAVTVTTSRGVYRAKAAIGADGAKGMARRFFSQSEPRSRVARLLEVINLAPESAPHFKDRFALFDFTPVREHLQGYFWDFPSSLDNHPAFNRGVYDSRVSASRPRAHLPRLLNSALGSLEFPPDEIQLEGHPIHWFSPRSRFAMPRLLLVGDAAGVDSLFGEGIGPALGYGQVAAQAVQRAFEQEDFTFQDYSRQLLTSSLGRYLLTRWSIAWFGYRLSGQTWYMHIIWTLGSLLARLWPTPPPLY